MGRFIKVKISRDWKASWDLRGSGLGWVGDLMTDIPDRSLGAAYKGSGKKIQKSGHGFFIIFYKEV